MRHTEKDGHHPAAAARRIGLACALFGLLASAPGWAADTPTVTAESIVREAVAHSLQLQSSDKEIEAAAARQSQARAQEGPSLDVQLQAAHYEGLVQTTLGPNLVIPEIDNHYGAAATLSQPVYAGGRLRGQIDSAAFQTQAVRQRRRSAEADLSLQALTAYWNWAKAFYSLEVLRAAVARMEAHAQDVLNQHEAGLATDNDALAADVLLDQTRLRLEEAGRQVEVARARIAYLVGRDLPGNASPEPVAPLRAVTAPVEKDLIESALANRPERAARMLDVRAAEEMVTVNRAGTRPSVALGLRYEENRPNNLFFPPEDKWNDDAFAGVSVSWNLFDSGLSRGRVAEAVARLAQARLRLAQSEEEIALEVKESRIGLQNALARLIVAERAAKSAQRNLEAAADLWQNGLARNSDVLDAHAQLTDAQNEIVTVRADIALSRAALDHATGRLGESAGPAQGAE